MKCHICKCEEATIHYIENTNNIVQEFYICTGCAEKSGFTNICSNDKTSLVDVLSGMFGNIEQKRPNLKCSTCGTTYQDLLDSQKFGCSECYNIFGEFAESFKKKLFGNVKHNGKAALNYKKMALNARKTAYLKLNLRKAVVREDYEEAARLRDALSMLK